MMAKLAIAAAAAGVGRPLKCRWSSSSVVSTLNRASRNAAQAAYDAAITQTASRCKYANRGHIFTSRKPGATPNVTKSHKLSNCAPKSLVVFDSRAT